MLSRLRKLAEGLLPLCVAATLVLCPLLPSFAADHAPPAANAAPMVALRVGEHNDYTRLVFDFTRLTAYTADRDGQAIVLNFDSPASVALPAEHFHLIDNIEAGKPDANSLRVAIKMSEGATAKDYRLNNKILVDIYAAPKKPGKSKVAEATPPKKIEPPKKKEERKPAPKVAEAKPPEKAAPETAEATPAEKPAAKTAEAAPAEKPAATSVTPAEKPAAAAPETPPEKPPQTAAAAPPAPAPAPNAAALNAVPGIIVDKPPEMPAAPPAAVDQEPTKISISTVEPTRLAVFSRFDILWIVLDSEAAGAVAPDVSGPEAGLLGNGKVVRFKGGTAYRFVLPAKRYLSIEKHSLTWEVRVSTTPVQTPSNTQVNVDYDEGSRTAKLMTELQDGSNPLEVQDPETGDTLWVMATLTQGERVDQARRFPEIEILPAAIGMAVRPIADDIKVNRLQNFVMITAPNGITATPGAIRYTPPAEGEDDPNQTRLFDFPNWQHGGITKLYRNRRILEDKVAAATKPEERQEMLMKLALLYFANNFGQEALGVLRLIEQENEDMPKNPNFIALRGAASAMAGHYQEALNDLSQPLLQQHPEVNLWIGYAAAASEQWHKANSSFPTTNRLLLQYPDNISVPITIYMAESALRLGHTESANTLLNSLDTMSTGLDRHYQAAIQYLKGEAARQSGKDDDAIKLWEPVAFGLDRLYHTKASLALANLRLQDKKINLTQAIDVVDSLRFAWRGDGLEVQILQNLGDLKVQNKQFLSGLEDMNRAAALADDMLDDSQPIKDNMSRIFSNVFVGGQSKEISPLEAVSIYQEFNQFMPQGADASVATLNFADSLINIDLLDKAEKLFEDQIKGGQVAAAKLPAVGAKLATIYLLDNAPDKALTALQNTAGDGGDANVKAERELLKARALSQLNRTDEAIALLSQIGSKDALHLKADVLWRAKKWGEAAAAIEQMLPPCGKPLADEDAQLAVNAAVAYKLAKDDANLQKTKSCYGDMIKDTKVGPTFAVVTRNSGGSSLADRDTLMKITGEVDMFKGFLDNYKAGKGL